MSRYDDEDFLPWYRRATPGWLELSAGARGVLVSVSMELHHRTGELTLRRGLASLSTLLRLPWELVEPALTELFSAGKLAWDADRAVLFDPEYADRKRPTSADRMRAKRARDKADTIPPPSGDGRDRCDACDVTPVTDPSCDASDGTSILFSSSSFLSDQKIPEEIHPRARVTPDPAAPPPDWWDGALETIKMETGTELPRGEAWLRYAGHRAEKRLPAERRHAIYWLTTVMVKEAADARDVARRRDAREAKWDRQRAGPSQPEQPTREQSKAMAAELVSRVLAGRKGAA